MLTTGLKNQNINRQKKKHVFVIINYLFSPLSLIDSLFYHNNIIQLKTQNWFYSMNICFVVRVCIRHYRRHHEPKVWRTLKKNLKRIEYKYVNKNAYLISLFAPYVIRMIHDLS